mmetsp:Transcript_32159/g.58807  ORF Transcript_32159/g.58807 Transcript_32159/m.58807 type:complete len:270 (-) Transcript_32159:667-1476(-)
MLFLPGLGCFRDLLVELLDAFSQGLDLIGESGDGLLGFLNGQLQVRDGLLKTLDLVIGGVELLLAVGLLLVIFPLLLSENLNELIYEGEDLLKAHLLAGECHGDEVKSSFVTRVCNGGLLDQLQSSARHVSTAGLDLHEAWAWKGLLEEFKGIVVVEDLDGLSKSKLLLCALLLDLFPLLVLCRTVLIHVGQELLILRQAFLGIFQIIRHLGNLNAQLACAGRLLLDGLCVCCQLLFLGCLQLCLVLLCSLFSLSDFSQLLLHLVLHDL